MITIFDPLDKTVTVATGTGTASFNICGIIKSICVKAANAAATYKISMKDDSSFDRFVTGILPAGNNTVDGEWVTKTKSTITISNASVDGAYLVRIYYVNY